MNKNKNIFTRFDSPEEYLVYLKAIYPVYKTEESDRSFMGDSLPLALRKLAEGDQTYLPAAQALIDKMADEQVFSEHLPIIETSVCGFMPNVPNAIRGVPKAMYTRYKSEHENLTTPLTIYVETLVSGGVDHNNLIQRGTAILAFVLAMNAIRPVEIYAVSIAKPHGCGGTGITGGVVVKIPSKPLDLERAAFMLCDPAYYRRIAFAAMYEHAKVQVSGHIDWAWDSSPTASEYVPQFREMLELQSNDVFLQGGYLFDKLMLENPVQWVKNLIRRHNGTEQELEAA